MDHQYSLFGDSESADGYNPEALTRLLDQVAASDAHHPGYARALSALHTQHHALDVADSAVGDTGLFATKAVSDWSKQQLNGIISGLNDKFHAIAGTSTQDPLSWQAGQLMGQSPADCAAMSPRTHLSMLHHLDGGLGATAEVVRHATTDARRIAEQLHPQNSLDNW